MTNPADDLAMIERLEGLGRTHCSAAHPVDPSLRIVGWVYRLSPETRGFVRVLPRLLALARLGLEAEERERAAWNKGRDAGMRWRNISGCVCVFGEDEEAIESLCDAHREHERTARREEVQNLVALYNQRGDEIARLRAALAALTDPPAPMPDRTRQVEEAVAVARREEREACAQAVCAWCVADWPFKSGSREFHKNPRGNWARWKRQYEPCTAAAIRAREALS